MKLGLMDLRILSNLRDSVWLALGERMGLLLGIVGVLWGIHLVNVLVGGKLLGFGIRPRTWDGLWGILYAPFLHANFSHLLANSLTFIPLAALVSVRSPIHLASVSLLVVFVGGLGTWLLGRPSTHIGASGVTFGYIGYLLAAAWFARHPLDIVISLGVAITYGGMLWGVLPSAPGVSWESHLFGALAGVFASNYLH